MAKYYRVGLTAAQSAELRQESLWPPLSVLSGSLRSASTLEHQGGAYMQKLVASEVDWWRKILVGTKAGE